MEHCKNQLTMIMTQYYCKTLSNCTASWIIDDLISGPLTEVIQTMTQNGVREHMMRPDLCKFLIRSDVTTFAILVNLKYSARVTITFLIPWQHNKLVKLINLGYSSMKIWSWEPLQRKPEVELFFNENLSESTFLPCTLLWTSLKTDRVKMNVAYL